MPEVPLADQRRRVAFDFQRLGERGFVRRQTIVVCVLGKRILLGHRVSSSVRSGTDTAGHQGRARRRTKRHRHVEVRQSHAFAGQPIDVGRLKLGMTVTAQVAPAEIVGEDKDNVGLATFLSGSCTRESQKSIAKNRSPKGECVSSLNILYARLFHAICSDHENAEVR